MTIDRVSCADFWKTGSDCEKIGGDVDVVVDGILVRGAEGVLVVIGFVDCDGLINNAVRPAPTEALAAAISIVDLDIVTVSGLVLVLVYATTTAKATDDKRNIKKSY